MSTWHEAVAYSLAHRRVTFRHAVQRRLVAARRDAAQTQRTGQIAAWLSLYALFCMCLCYISGSAIFRLRIFKAVQDLDLDERDIDI
jgi:hypothetical protein